MPELVLPEVSFAGRNGFRVSFGPIELQAGERLMIFGPNGAGKSTVLRLLAARIGVRGPGAAASYQPQRPYMFRGTAARNLALGLSAEEGRLAEELAAAIGVGGMLGSAATTLSGGERQRLALARTLARPAPLVLLDEPLAAIDVRHRDLVIGTLSEALGGRTAVVVTHDREVVAALGDRAAVMLDGRVRQLGDVEEVFSLPADEDVAEAVGLGNVLAGEVVDVEEPMVEVAVAGTSVWAYGPQPVGAAVKVMFGAEAVTVYTGTAGPSSARNAWSGEITAIRSVGRLVEIVVDVGPSIAALITPGSLDALGLEVGGRAGLSLKATAAHAVSAPTR